MALEPGAKITVDPTLAALEPTEVGSRKEAPGKVGETVRTPDWEVTITEVLRGDEAKRRIEEEKQRAEAEGSISMGEPAPAGKEYVLAHARVRYIGTEKPDYPESIDAKDFEVVGEKNVIHAASFDALVSMPEPHLDATLFPGGQAEGWVGLQVDEGEQGLIAIFEPTTPGQKDTGDENKAFLALE